LLIFPSKRFIRKEHANSFWHRGRLGRPGLLPLDGTL
jgi:hypothetical protein